MLWWLTNNIVTVAAMDNIQVVDILRHMDILKANATAHVQSTNCS